MSNLNLKSTLKSLKLHESTISMILGAIVIVVLGIIVVNYFRDLKTGEIPKEAPTTTTKEGEPKVIRGMGSVTYTVSEGESLWEIAEKQYNSGYNWIDIAEENALANPNKITVGQELTIPDVEPKQLTILKVDKEVGEIEPISGATYTVQKGDTLWNIAIRAYGDGYKWVDIAKENNLANPNLIHKGNELTVPRK